MTKNEKTVQTRRCIFCGNVLNGMNRSKEHIFPQWLQQHLSLKSQSVFPTLYTTTGEVDQDRRMTFNGLVSGLVCSKCNSGWMSVLETEAQPILLPLIDGDYVGEISHVTSTIMSRWCVKTAYALHSVSYQAGFVPDEHYRSVLNGGIPEQIGVSIGKIRAQDDFFWIQNQNWYGQTDDLTLEDFRRTYRFTMRFGCLAVRVHYWPLNVGLTEHFAEGVVYPWWYFGPRCIVWPPSGILSNLQELEESLLVVRPLHENMQEQS